MPPCLPAQASRAALSSLAPAATHKQTCKAAALPAAYSVCAAPKHAHVCLQWPWLLEQGTALGQAWPGSG